MKLSQKRVDELISNGQGENFDTGGGRIMKEWVVIKAGDADWKELAFLASENKINESRRMNRLAKLLKLDADYVRRVPWRFCPGIH